LKTFQNINRTFVIIILSAAVLLIVATLVSFSAQKQKPPREAISSALVDLSSVKSKNVNLNFIVQSNASNNSSRYSLNLKGIAERRTEDEFAFDGTGNVGIRKKGIELIISFFLRSINGANYFNFKELPASKKVTDVLVGKWVEASQEWNNKISVKSSDMEPIINKITSPEILKSADWKGADNVQGVSADKYDLGLDKEKLKAYLGEIEKDNEKQPIKNSAYNLKNLLESYDLQDTSVWVKKNSNELLRVKGDFKSKKDDQSTVTFDLMLSSLSGNSQPSIERPSEIQKIDKPDAIYRLIFLGSS